MELVIEPDFTNNLFLRKGRATLRIKVNRDTQTYFYRASASVHLFDPEDEELLNEPPTDETSLQFPFWKDELVFDLDLGINLLEKIEKSRSDDIELQVRVTLHLEPASTKSKFLSSYNEKKRQTS